MLSNFIQFCYSKCTKSWESDIYWMNYGSLTFCSRDLRLEFEIWSKAEFHFLQNKLESKNCRKLDFCFTFISPLSSKKWNSVLLKIVTLVNFRFQFDPSPFPPSHRNWAERNTVGNQSLVSYRANSRFFRTFLWQSHVRNIMKILLKVWTSLDCSHWQKMNTTATSFANWFLIILRVYSYFAFTTVWQCDHRHQTIHKLLALSPYLYKSPFL